ncbi:MAG: hypothetical protein ACTSR8_14520 [Promethearchaeota archaeon]
MVKTIITDDNWQKEILEIANKFNDYAKKGSMRMMSFLLDKAFNILSDDRHKGNLDVAEFLKRVRASNPKMITPYVSTLIDAKLGKAALEDPNYVVPDYIRYPASEKQGDEIKVYLDEPKEKKVSDNSQTETIDVEKKTQPETVKSELLSWDMFELIKFNIIRNLTKITYDEIDSPIKKCASGDGAFDKKSTDIWKCTECGTAYHENCVKIISLLEGICRICSGSFLVESEKSSNMDKTEN